MSDPVFVTFDAIDRPNGTYNVYVCTIQDGIQHALEYREIQCSRYPSEAAKSVWKTLYEILDSHNMTSHPIVVGCDGSDVSTAMNFLDHAKQTEDRLFTYMVRDKTRKEKPGFWFQKDMYKLERLQKWLRNDALVDVENIGYKSPKQLADDLDALLLADDMEALFTSGTVYRGANVPHVLLAVEMACLTHATHFGMDNKYETTRVA